MCPISVNVATISHGILIYLANITKLYWWHFIIAASMCSVEHKDLMYMPQLAGI